MEYNLVRAEPRFWGRFLSVRRRTLSPVGFDVGDVERDGDDQQTAGRDDQTGVKAADGGVDNRHGVQSMNERYPMD